MVERPEEEAAVNLHDGAGGCQKREVDRVNLQPRVTLSPLGSSQCSTASAGAPPVGLATRQQAQWKGFARTLASKEQRNRRGTEPNVGKLIRGTVLASL